MSTGRPNHHHHAMPPAGFSSTAVPHMTRWNDICDEVLVPIASILAVFLLCAAVIAFS